MLLSPFTRQRLKTFISKEHFTFMDRLATLMASGDVKPAVGGRFNLDEVPPMRCAGWRQASPAASR